ncbi:sigma 54-interacting transcriptional regulator [Pedobacter sp. GSP4]|uniref:sigma 54-interacting transcriptional regulator n=1 Tax=Pedobacter sp. GSP4 TaxID=3453716 RepID=UPI003EE8E66E
MPKKILIVEDEFIIADTLRGILKRAGYQVCGIADTVAEAMEAVQTHHPDFVLVDIFLIGELSGIDLANRLSELNIPFIYISANSNHKVLTAAKKTNPYGFVIKPFREKDVLVALEIALYRHQKNIESGQRQNTALLKKTDQIIGSKKDWKQKICDLGQALQPFIPFELMSVCFESKGNPDVDLGFLRIAFNEYQIIGGEELATIGGNTPLAFSKQATEPENLDTTALRLFGTRNKKMISDIFNMQSDLDFALEVPGKGAFHFSFFSKLKNAYSQHHVAVFETHQALLTDFILKVLPHEAVYTNTSFNPGKVELANVHRPNPFNDIIGSSHLLLKVFDEVSQVAPADSSVLILGESGTGKEKIAYKIHELSSRRDKPFVKVNCAALSSSLVESELFGHEKGAFTGAFERAIGKFERAHTGTIFLDEIGEIPVDIQVKLLRVLQEKEIERVGGRTTIKTDVRIVAATNRNLETEVAEGRFRLDLYYRLNVFPIIMPPLRDRNEDIPALVDYFLQVSNKRTGREVKAVSQGVINQMKQYEWPGNIRELENLMERNVLLSKDGYIHDIEFPFSQTKKQEQPAFNEVSSMSEGEKKHIIAALKKCKGKIWGIGGAAELLQLPPTTLNSKMKKLGISKDSGFY